MSWIAKLNETYDAICEKSDSHPWPISHFFKTAHIEAVIGTDGDLKKNRIRLLEGAESGTLIPATEASAGRSGTKIAPHPLSEELGYCAGDLPDINEEKHSAYMKLLTAWCSSQYQHPKAKAILTYLQQDRLWKDLSREIIFPIKFKSVGNKTTSIAPEKAFVRWRVEASGEPVSATWEDRELISSWIKYDAEVNERKGFCYVSGLQDRISENHSRFLRNSSDGAKIISANDKRGYTFRGRFVLPQQVATISFDVSQRAHNALRWLIKNQGSKNGEQAIVAWAVSGTEIPAPLVETTKYNWDDSSEATDQPTINEAGRELDYTIDLGQSYARKLNRYMAGYRAKLEQSDTISIMAIDSATPGRMGITYYRECLPQEYLDRISKWHTDFAWFQRVSREIPQPKGKPKPVTMWPVSAPSPYSIMQAVYGDILKSNASLKKNFFERLIPSIIEGTPVPQDFVHSAYNRARHPAGKEKWEWEKCLGIACSLYRGFHLRHPQHSERKEYAVSLDTSIQSRDYLYGRLLAIAERTEEIALSAAQVNRPTNASRLMQRFSDRPYSTWPIIYKQLDPYIRQLKTSRPGFLFNMMKELDEVMDLFDTDDFRRDTSLAGEFLLGFHAERLALRTKPQTSDEDTTEPTEE